MSRIPKTRLSAFIKGGQVFFAGTLLSVGFAASALASPQACTPDGLIIWDLSKMEAAKARLDTDDDSLEAALYALMRDADRVVDQGPWSVTTKTQIPPSGDVRDYFSIGPYWWPDPSKADGLPYIRRDGETNPARKTDAFDTVAMGAMARAVGTLSLAAYFGEDSIYGDRAAELIRVWFLDADTRMNPNLKFAQSIPGRTDGRGIGIIDTYRLVKVVDAARLLERGGYLSDDDMVGLRAWFRDYALWLIRSENGQEERLEENNHGIYYDVQLATFATFAGDRTVLSKVIKGVRDQRIPSQIDGRGRMPLELKRTRAFHYTAFTHQALIDLAEMARCQKDGIYGYQTKRGAGLSSALSFQAKYVGRMSSWRYPEIRTPRTEILFENLCRTARPLGDEGLINAYNRVEGDYADSRMRLLTDDCR